jgi:tRNA-uridine 2-sulfurtransferase
MNKKQTIAVGMSGGVDSSVTALLLKEQGYNVIGVIMKVWSGEEISDAVKVNSSCYGPDEAEDIAAAKEVAKAIGVELYEVDLKEEYKNEVIDYFRGEYAEGRTPNPCVKCNWKIKFGDLIKKAREMGLVFDKFATGHYASVEYDEGSGRYLLKRAKDRSKDQTYFMSFLSQDQLSECVFPLGVFLKSEIKEKAKNLGLKLEEKKESQNFAAMGHESLLGGLSKPGDFVDTEGNVLGEHRGIPFYTIGQRKGLGVSHSFPLYVIAINKDKNQVVLGAKEKLVGYKLIAKNPNWIAFEKLEGVIEVSAKIRYVQKEYQARLTPRIDDKVLVEFFDPQSAITPGQTVVFYQDDLVVGAGVIEEAL